MKVFVLLVLVYSTLEVSLTEVIGMEHMLEGLGKMNPVEYAKGENSTLYSL